MHPPLQSVLFVLFLGIICNVAASSDKINKKLSTSLKHKGSTNIFITFHQDTGPVLDSFSTKTFMDRSQKINALVTALRNLASETQKDVTKYLEKDGIAYKQFWIENTLFIKSVNLELVEKLAFQFPDIIEEIYEEEFISLAPGHAFEENSNEPQDIQWGVEKIGANLVWNLPGNTNGSGIVIGTISTGARHTHEALISNYRTTHGWFDPDFNFKTPFDDDGHGTRMLGIMVGQGGIGVAPGAQWIACKGCAYNGCATGWLVACGEWMVCPTDANGQHADCSKAPNVIGNSFGSTAGSIWYNRVLRAWLEAGIVPVWAFGNTGPQCSTGHSPADTEFVIAVGSSLITDGVQLTSSKGPSQGLIKPEIVAPGFNIRSASSVSDTYYANGSNTDVAMAHVAGSVALILGLQPNATYDQVKNVLFQNAARTTIPTGFNCSGVSEYEFPNNAVGHGRLDIYTSILSIAKSESLKSDSVARTSDIPSDSNQEDSSSTMELNNECGGVLSGPSGEINYKAGLENDVCIWSLTAVNRTQIRLELMDFRNSSGDVLTITELNYNLGTITQFTTLTSSGVYNFTGPIVIVTFQYNTPLNEDGFRLQFSGEGDPGETHLKIKNYFLGNNTLFVDYPEGAVPYVPDEFVTFIHPLRTTKSFYVYSISMSVVCSSDGLVINSYAGDGRYFEEGVVCGSILPGRAVADGPYFLVFKTASDLERSGFKALWSFHP